MNRLTRKSENNAIHDYEPTEYGNDLDRIDLLGEYEDLEEQGLLIKLPCKVGTDIFRIVNKRIGRGNNRKFNLTIQRGKAQWGDYDKFGKTAFLTREEAEKALEDKANE